MPVTGDMCQYPGWLIEQGAKWGTMLTDLMAGEDNFQKAMDASEILMLIPPDPSAAFDEVLRYNWCVYIV